MADEMSSEMFEIQRRYLMAKYAAVTLLFFYRADVEDADTVSEFRDRNPTLVQQVFDEMLDTFKYELSMNQMDQAIAAFITSLASPLSPGQKD